MVKFTKIRLVRCFNIVKKTFRILARFSKHCSEQILFSNVEASCQFLLTMNSPTGVFLWLILVSRTIILSKVTISAGVYIHASADMVDFFQNLRKNESAKYGCFLKMVAFLAIGETSEIKPRAVIIYLFKSNTVEPL